LLGLEIFLNGDVFSSCLEETISFVHSNYCLFEKNYERFLTTYKSCKTHKLEPREHKLIHIGEVTKHTKTLAIMEELNLSPK
jgi:ribosomal protein S17